MRLLRLCLVLLAVSASLSVAIRSDNHAAFAAGTCFAPGPNGTRIPFACQEDGSSSSPGSPSGPSGPASPPDNCNWQRASATGPDAGSVGAIPASSGFPEATRDNNGVTEYMQVRMCRRPNGAMYNTGQVRWTAAGTPDPDPSGTIQRLYLLGELVLDDVVPTLNPEDPRSQILFLPTWMQISNPESHLEFASITSPYSGLLATATATPIGINFDPGNGEDELYCDSLGVAWTYGDDERLDNNPNAIPDACRFEYQELPEANGEVTAQIGLRYSITYTGLTQPLDNGTMTEEYDGPMTPLPLRIREQVAVNMPNGTPGNARSSS